MTTELSVKLSIPKVSALLIPAIVCRPRWQAIIMVQTLTKIACIMKKSFRKLNQDQRTMTLPKTSQCSNSIKPPANEHLLISKNKVGMAGNNLKPHSPLSLRITLMATKHWCLLRRLKTHANISPVSQGISLQAHPGEMYNVLEMYKKRLWVLSQDKNKQNSLLSKFLNKIIKITQGCKKLRPGSTLSLAFTRSMIAKPFLSTEGCSQITSPTCSA